MVPIKYEIKIKSNLKLFFLVPDLKMPQWASAEGGGSEAESPDQVMLYFEDETSEYYDNKPDIADKIEQAGGKIYKAFIDKSGFNQFFYLCGLLQG